MCGHGYEPQEAGVAFSDQTRMGGTGGRRGRSRCAFALGGARDGAGRAGAARSRTAPTIDGHPRGRQHADRRAAAAGSGPTRDAGQRGSGWRCPNRAAHRLPRISSRRDQTLPAHRRRPGPTDARRCVTTATTARGQLGRATVAARDADPTSAAAPVATPTPRADADADADADAGRDRADADARPDLRRRRAGRHAGPDHGAGAAADGAQAPMITPFPVVRMRGALTTHRRASHAR